MKKRQLLVFMLVLGLCLSFIGCKATDTPQSGVSGGTVSDGSVSQPLESEPSGEDASSPDGASSQPEASGDPTVSSSGGSAASQPSSGKPGQEVSGEVTVAVNTARATDYKGLFDQFAKAYPNIKLKFQYFQHKNTDENKDNAMEFLTAQASTNSMPDIVFDDAGFLTYYISQGWVYPVDEFVKNDAEFKDIPQNILNCYKFGGQLYALPGSMHFNGVFINLDAMNELNLKHPALDWDFNDMADFLKKGTTAKFSGIEDYLNKEIMHYSALYNTKGGAVFCYDMNDRKVDLNGFTQAVAYVKQLHQYPGLVAKSLKDNQHPSSYVRKFGQSNISAQDQGLTLVQPGIGSWVFNTIRGKEFKYEYELWPAPQQEKGRMAMHVDYSFMTSVTKNPKAAFELLRYVTYGVDGNLARLGMYDKANKGKYELNSKYYFPATQNKQVKAKFESLPSVGKYETYCYQNAQKCFLIDNEKFVPNWKDMQNGLILPQIEKILSGTANADDVVADLENKANSYLKARWDAFDKQLKTVQAQFAAKKAAGK